MSHLLINITDNIEWFRNRCVYFLNRIKQYNLRVCVPHAILRTRINHKILLEILWQFPNNIYENNLTYAFDFVSKKQV